MLQRDGRLNARQWRTGPSAEICPGMRADRQTVKRTYSSQWFGPLLGVKYNELEMRGKA